MRDLRGNSKCFTAERAPASSHRHVEHNHKAIKDNKSTTRSGKVTSGFSLFFKVVVCKIKRIAAWKLHFPVLAKEQCRLQLAGSAERSQLDPFKNCASRHRPGVFVLLGDQRWLRLGRLPSWIMKAAPKWQFAPIGTARETCQANSASPNRLRLHRTE